MFESVWFIQISDVPILSSMFFIWKPCLSHWNYCFFSTSVMWIEYPLCNCQRLNGCNNIFLYGRLLLLWGLVSYHFMSAFLLMTHTPSLSGNKTCEYTICKILWIITNFRNFNINTFTTDDRKTKRRFYFWRHLWKPGEWMYKWCLPRKAFPCVYIHRLCF